MSDIAPAAMIRMEALKLAVKVELAIFENRDDKRSEEKLKEDIRNTAAKFDNYICQNQAT